MKWLDRGEWHDAFEEVFQLHLVPACESAGIEMSDLASVIGDDLAMNVWGCVFEDFLSRARDDGRNIVDDYLKRRGWKESASTRAYMSGLRTSVMSLYEVSNIVRDTSFLARDLIRGGDPILIGERSATRCLKPWDFIAARVVRVGSKNVMGGGVLPFGYEASEHLLKAIRGLKGRGGKRRRKAPVGLRGDKVEAAALVLAATDDLMLRTTGPVFTTVWLADILARAMNPRIPKLQNSDGDEIMFCTAHFPLARDAAIEDIQSALQKRPELVAASSTFWNWIATGKPAEDGGAKARSVGQQIQTFSTSLDDGSLVLGNVELTDRTLVLSVNSKPRADKGRTLIAEALGALVGEPLIEMQTMDQLRASQGSKPSPARPVLPPEEHQEIIRATLDSHYRRVLDEPVPALGNVSPRDAAKTDKGRARLVTWLKRLENQSADLADGNGSTVPYDATWLWDELGVSRLRR